METLLRHFEDSTPEKGKANLPDASTNKYLGSRAVFGIDLLSEVTMPSPAEAPLVAAATYSGTGPQRVGDTEQMPLDDPNDP
jgi:hypothetical protein